MSIDNVQKLVLITPVNEPDTTESTCAPRLDALAGQRLGLLDNSKSKANKLLDALAALLHEQYGCDITVRHRKPSASKPVAPEVIEEFRYTCDLVLVGVGD